jgi:hypothetical protein
VDDVVQSQGNPHGIHGAQSGTGTDFFVPPRTLVFTANHYFTNDEYSSITACQLYDKSNQPA